MDKKFETEDRLDETVVMTAKERRDVLRSAVRSRVVLGEKPPAEKL